MIGTQLIDDYARNISDEKQQSVISGSAAGTNKRYQVLHKDYPDPDALRKLAASIKDHTLHHLGDYLAKAEQALVSRGVNVHFASTDEDARQTILSILQGHGVTQLTKSKSMAAEEIHLNPFLIENGVECLESDLGEFIIQLDGDEPSHIVKPIIHKNRREIAETFPHTEGPGFGTPRPPDDTPFAEAIRSGEGSAEDRLASAMQWKVRGWIEEGTDLRELYCEKRISRQELLDGLKVRIPGSEAHPLELERAAWTETLPCSDPEQASEWGRELLRRGDLSRLLDDARREFSKDPRGSLKLDRLHVAIALNPKGWALPMLLEDVVKEWKDWEDLSPPDARRWRALMKEDDPMARAIRNTGAGEKTIGVEK